MLTAFALFSVVAMLMTCVCLVSDESDAALGAFTGGENRSSPSNPYTEIDCDISDLEDNFGFDVYEHIYYVELGSRFDITGRDPNSEFQGYDSSRMTLADPDKEWDSQNFWGFFTDTGQAAMGTSEDFAVIFEVVCTNDTKVEEITVSGASSGSVTLGYRPNGTNAERDYLIYTTPRYNASPAPTTTVTVEQTSGRDVASFDLGISASGLVPHLKITPKGIGTATFLIEATDGGGASTVFTVNVSEYKNGVLTFNANGGSGAPASMTDESYTGKFYYEIPQQEPTRSGYEFKGWSPDRYATEAEYFYDGQNDLDWRYDTSLASDTLYAVWERTTQTFTATLEYSANGGSNAPASQTASMTGTSASGSKSFIVTDSVPVRDGFVCVGWALSSKITLFAVWEQASITMTGNPQGFGVVGTSWSYSPNVSVEGCTLTVSGASWLVVSGDTIVGTPTSAGTFEITVTAQKAGYQSATQTFTVQVLSNLFFQSSPEGGAIIYAV